MEEPVTDMIPEDPEMWPAPEASDSINTRPVDWERREKDNGVPYYANHMTKKTVWTHPGLTEFITSLQALNEIRFPTYRTAIKLRKIQMKLTLDNFNIDNMQKAFRTVSPDPTATIEVIILAAILYDLYENSKQRARQVKTRQKFLPIKNYLGRLDSQLAALRFQP